MKKLSQINEGLWTSSLKRSKGEEVRKEDNIGNINDIKFIDIGTNILWSDKYFENGDDKLFTLDEAFEIEEMFKSKGYRLPTCDEFCDLSLHREDNGECQISLSFRSGDYNYVTIGPTGVLCLLSYGWKITGEDNAYFWTSEKMNPTSQFVCGYLNKDSRGEFRWLRDTMGFNINKYKCAIRLVKGK